MWRSQSTACQPPWQPRTESKDGDKVFHWLFCPVGTIYKTGENVARYHIRLNAADSRTSS